MRQTRYEALKDRLVQLRQKREETAASAEELRRKAAQALANGLPAPVVKVDFNRELALLDAAIAEAEAQLRDPAIVREYVEARRAAIAAELEQLRKEREPYVREVQKAQARLTEAQERLNEVVFRQRGRIEALQREDAELRALLDQTQAEAAARADEPDPARVEALLADLRAGRIRSVMKGQDPALDAAWDRYEAERDELRRWARRAKGAAKAGADRPAPPACARHYTRERLREITGLRDLPGFNEATTVVKREEVTA